MVGNEVFGLDWIGDECGKKMEMKVVKAVEATPENFLPFGQVIQASPATPFGPDDQLDLRRGIPRFYLMTLQDRKLNFFKITHHASVAQCLGSIGGGEWYVGVAKASIVDGGAIEENEDGRKVVKSNCGHYYIPPSADDVIVFRITGSKFLKFNVGTWHAGPLFKSKSMDFYNLELSETNVVDHTTHDFASEGVMFVIDD